MGRLGTGAYDVMRKRYGEAVVGVDRDLRNVRQQQQAGRNTILGDATDSEFWAKVQPGKVRLALLALPDHKANTFALREIRARGLGCMIGATAKFDDEVTELLDNGVDVAFNYYAEAGFGFGEQVSAVLGERIDTGG